MTMLTCKKILEYTVPLTTTTELRFQLEKSDIILSLNSESGLISSPTSSLCRVKIKELHTETKGSLESSTIPSHFPKSVTPS